LIKQLKVKLISDKHLHELVRGSSIAFVYRIVGLVLGYVFTLIIARGFGAETMGIYSLSLTVLGIAALVGKLGLDTALLKFVAELSAQKRNNDIRKLYNKVLQISIPFSIIIAIALYFTSPMLAEFVFHKKYLSDYFQIVSFGVVPIILMTINGEAIRGLKNIKVYMFLTSIALVLIATVFLIIFYFYSQDSSVPLIAQIISIFIVSILSFIFWYQLHGKGTKNDLSSEDINYKNIISVSLPMLITASMGAIMGVTDMLMLGIYATATDVGVYSVALKISMIASLALVAITTIAAPKFAEFWGRNDMDGLSKIAQQSTKLIFWTSFPVLIILLLFPSFILGVFGDQFIIGSVALMILAFGQFINAISGSVGYILNMTGSQKILQYTAMISAIINIILNYFLIPEYGLTGAAIATVISTACWNILCVIYIYKKMNILVIYIPKIRKKNVD